MAGGKKGKGKGPARPPPAAQAGPSKKNAAKDSKNLPTDDEMLIFTTDKPKKKGGPSSDGASGAAPAPPKPSVKQIIGGTSWTGKLPVNLLSEHCQRQKWEKPDYSMHTTDEGFSSFVTLCAKNPKTREMTKLPSFKLPPTHKHLAVKPTPLEARHFAATYALFRVCSMRNIHTTLPPDYRALWKEFDTLKKADVKDGKAWMYDADPFNTLREREASKAAAEKKRQEAQKAREKAQNMPGASGLALRNNASDSTRGNPMKGWMAAPKVELGRKTRNTIEDLLRKYTIWNPHRIVLSPSEKKAIVDELKRSGFRQSHVEEAVDECKDREETLEWLLIHVPEDDLPRWALPESYTAGVSVAATDLKREGAIERLSASGYSSELCKRVYDENGGDEGKAAEKLQQILLYSGSNTKTTKTEEAVLSDAWDSPEDCWEQEMDSLESVFGEQFSRPAGHVCQIRLTNVVNGPKKNVDASLQIQKPPHYPAHIILAITADLPSYIKLSLIKNALAYVDKDLQAEEMKIYFVIDWMQQNINEIIERPGVLREIAAVASAASEAQAPPPRASRKRPRHPKPISWKPDLRLIEGWKRRQQSPAQRDFILQRQKLPAWKVQQEVVDAVSSHQVTIISGETGSGKSTQSVQFILDDLYSQGLGNGANIVVTQPRRISALGLADRVAEERCSTVGQEVGYTIRGENRVGPNTKITFVTTGVLLRRLQTSGGRIDDVVASLADVSHIVIDEVHERSLDTDFLLSIIRDVLRKRKDLKLVLMSATLDAYTFKYYFASDGISVGSVEIAGRTYPVQDHYLEDIIPWTGFSPNKDYYDGSFDDVKESDKSPDWVAKSIGRLGGRVNYDLIVETTRAIDFELDKTRGGILIFMPGVAEIGRTCNALRSISSLHVLPLHASLETREQRRVFQPAPPGKRKVVVATNVAETSITIDDIVAVIDTGKVKETSYDPVNNMRRLAEIWASRAACKQRRGRAGRVQAGNCYKLYTRKLEEQMPERPDPEIRRVPLEQLCLSVRAMGVRDVSAFLGRAPTPPENTAVEGALNMLRRMGALDGDELTALGSQLAMIPADLRCGKLMVYGAMFDCLDHSITISAILSTKSPFVSPQDRREESKQARVRFSRGDGDLLTDLRAFQAWDEMYSGRAPMKQIRSFCDENFLSHQTLNDISTTRAQYYTALSEIGITQPSSDARSTSNSANTSGATVAILRALTASAFTPQIARIQFPDKKFAASMAGAVELDPEARTIKYFNQENGRVFVHPSSTMFDNQGFSGNAAFMSYFSIISTSKIFVRDLTAFNAYSLLLFAGGIQLDTLGRGLVVDGWLRLRGWARIGVLISRLRGLVDDIIAQKMDNPRLDLRDNQVLKTVVKLVELDGLDA
ncbi:hypothetical protein MKZ38_000854 [Zalerion maritima]|uniref:DEAD/DEAH box helicase n=1 Tax=Zalerion maritima TaxID=339359 RepID=A0AAD5RXP0_9PEZI|nr:hypothetical protein MKZ38_000854 [Zalerion maritima]